MIKLTINGSQILAESNKKISAYLNIDFPCGGQGTCGKCKVIANGNLSPMTDGEKAFLTEEEISRGFRLACKTYALGDVEIFTLENTASRIMMGGEVIEKSLNPMIKKYGIAVDIGTTTVVVGLYTANGELVGKEGFLNPQKNFGADIVSRIEKSLSGEAIAMQKAIVESIENSVLQICKSNNVTVADVDGGVITGNTAMLYLLTSTPVYGLEKMPFSLKRPFGEMVLASEIGFKYLSPNTQIYLPPCISPFIGADTVCALVSTSFGLKDETCMMVDVGTNGEMVLYRNGETFACSTAAGPAFEGAGISCGMRGESGAIEHVRIENDKFAFQVIGDGQPKGICGSGVIDIVACLLKVGLLDETGYMEEDAELLNGIVFTRKDVRAVQLAKGAIYAGISTLLKTVGVLPKEVKNFMLAGGFGGYVDLKNAGEIGLLPKEWISYAKVLGNAAYNGAVAILLDKNMQKKCLQIAENTKVVELSNNELFLDEYTDGMMF